MNFKKIATTIELLAITSVMSVGFSAWAIVETTSPTVTATIETENVINNNEYLDINNVFFSDYYCLWTDTGDGVCSQGEITEGGFFKDFIYDTSESTSDNTGANGNSVAKFYFDIDVNLTLWNRLVNSASFSKLSFDIDITPPQGFPYWVSSVVTDNSFTGAGATNLSTSPINDSLWKYNIVVDYGSSATLKAQSNLTLNIVLIIDFGSSLKAFLNNTQQANFKGLNFKISASMGGA